MQDADHKVGRIVAQQRSRLNNPLPQHCCPCCRCHLSTSSLSSPLSLSSLLLLSDPAVASLVSALLTPAKHGQRPPNRGGGQQKSRKTQCRIFACSSGVSPLAIVFFTIVVIVVVRVGKGGHSLGAMECAPSFWLPWMAWRKWGECGMMVVGYGVLCSPPVHACTGMIRSNGGEVVIFWGSCCLVMRSA